MHILIFLGVALNIQVVVPCFVWSFPDDEPDCCARKKVGGDVYLFAAYEGTAEWNCYSNCAYTKMGDTSGTKYCFQYGGHMDVECQDQSVKLDWELKLEAKSVCVIPGTKVTFNQNGRCTKLHKVANDTCVGDTGFGDTVCEFTPSKPGTSFFVPKSKLLCETGVRAKIDADYCNCRSALEIDKMIAKSLENIDEDFKMLSSFASDDDDDTLPLTYNQTANKLFSLKLEIFPPNFQQLHDYASACSPEKIKCAQCFKYLMDAVFACITYKNTANCENYIKASKNTCKSCLCGVTKNCKNKPTNQCKEEEIKKNVQYNTCDRDCSSSLPKKCIFNLNLEERNTMSDGPNVDGGNRMVLAYNGSIPGPQIVICEGDELKVTLHNNLERNTTLHFHGIREIYRPWSDGVPWVTQYPIPSKGKFTYGFNATDYYGAPSGTYTQAGTYWYHSHFGAQRTDGAYGALIIRPNRTDDRFDVDKAENTIMVQEWYESPNSGKIRSLLVNGKGRVGTEDFTTNYTVYNITEPGKKYLFRIIGAISQNVPLRLSIDDHTFSAITADSQGIEPVHNLTDLWIAGGERFHIVVNTKTEEESNKQTTAYKIKVYGYANPHSENVGSGPYCTIAWLRYQSQTINSSFVADSSCENGFELPSSRRTLNPIPINYDEWNDGLRPSQYNETNMTGNIFIKDLRADSTRAEYKHPGLFEGTYQTSLMNTIYIDIADLKLNNISMSNPDVPFLLQNPADTNDRCGIECDMIVQPTLNKTDAEKERYTYCKPLKNLTQEKCKGDPENCKCQHVLQVPYAPFYWTEIVLINNKKDATAHPMHQHGGWFWVVGMGKYEEDINSTYIKKQDCIDEDHLYKRRCLPRNFNLPPAKDTLQVPPGGYAIIRTPLYNKGTWLIHCHINNHVLSGMAMVLQIGGFGKQKNETQEWCTGPLNTEDDGEPSG